jgi:hypothetical protein
MSVTHTGLGSGAAPRAARPPRAVVGSQVNAEEQIFAAFDGRILRRFWAFISPYRRRLVLAVLAVLVFAGSQIAIPLILRSVIDRALVEGALAEAAQAERLLAFGALLFFAIVTVNFFANLVQETLSRASPSASWSTCGAGCTPISSGSRCRSWTGPRSGA